MKRLDHRTYSTRNDSAEPAKTGWARMSHKTRIMLAIYAGIIIVLTVCKVAVFATTAPAADPLQAVNNLSTFIFGLIRAIGLILLAFGIVQIGLSLKSHDPSQRANGFLTFAGGIVITFTKEILTLITG